MDTQMPELQAVVERQCRELAERLEKVEGQCGHWRGRTADSKVAGVTVVVLLPSMGFSSEDN